MATRPTLTPVSTESATILPASGSSTNVASACPIGVYTTSDDFLNGAAAQVSYVYKKLGGDVLNVELTEGNVYAAYEEAVLEYSYIVNIHQAKNSLGDLLGTTTASFDQDGEIKVGDDLAGKNIESKYPRFTFHYAQRVGDGVADRSSFTAGGAANVYSASFSSTSSVQDYDLQDIVYSASIDSNNSYFPFYGKVVQNKITIKQMYYKVISK